MARTVGSWWIKDGIDGRRIEAQGFGATLQLLSGFSWTEDHGDNDVLEQDFVETAGVTERADNVDAVMMSSHGSPSGFSTSDGTVSTSDRIRFGKNDLEVFATHACNLLEHTPGNSVGRWIPAFERLHYMLGFHTSSYSGGQDARGSLFALHAAVLEAITFGLISFSLRDAWRIANTLVEGSNVEWAYLRATSPAGDTYHERLTTSEPTDPVTNRSFWTNRGTC